MDVVYTWVDDTFAGYGELLGTHAKSKHDSNANRTRDNLNLLKYSLRSLERFAPWHGKVFLFTCRPQIPSWLKVSHPDLVIVHHDEVMPPDLLPTFNSFSIVSFLHKLPGLARRFVYFEDDMILMAPTARSDFEADDGRLIYHLKGELPLAGKNDHKMSPWNAALSNNAGLLDAVSGAKRHQRVAPYPKPFDIGDWQDALLRWPDVFARTRRARFRSHDNIAPEVLLPVYLVETGKALRAPENLTHSRLRYMGLENFALWNRLRLAAARKGSQAFLTLNDNFGNSPRPNAQDVVRRFLESVLPEPSRFER